MRVKIGGCVKVKIGGCVCENRRAYVKIGGHM